MSSTPTHSEASGYRPGTVALLCRFLAWSTVSTLAVFLLNSYLSIWRDWPGASAVFTAEPAGLGWLQALLYAGAVLGAALFVRGTPERSLRADDAAITRLAAYLIEAAFWMVVLVGVVDAVISFLRVEDLLPRLVGEELASELGRNAFRGPVVHGPLMVLGLLLPLVFRGGINFVWLAALVVLAELQIVILRFVFSYEQTFMGDLVRMWYASLFLFASAYTLVQDAHVRVDVFYAAFDQRRRGMVNAVGSVLLGLPLCWSVLIIGMADRTSIIASPLVNLTISQSSFGMYTKYLMAGFLAVFAVTMALQFAGYFLQGVADHRGDPGGQPQSSPDSAH